MEHTELYPAHRQLAAIIAAKESENKGGFYADDFLADALEVVPGTDGFRFAWMACREILLHEHGIDFKRVRFPQRGYYAMSDAEKVNYGFDRRINKTKRNARRAARSLASVDYNRLCDDDQRAYDSNMHKMGLVESVLKRLPRGVKRLRLEIEVDRSTPGIK